MTDKQLSKADKLRAMREATFTANHSSGAKGKPQMPAGSKTGDGLARNSSDGGVESRHATESEGAAYPKAQANQLPAKSSYRTTGEVAPAGPRVGSRIAADGVAPIPSEANLRNETDNRSVGRKPNKSPSRTAAPDDDRLSGPSGANPSRGLQAAVTIIECPVCAERRRRKAKAQKNWRKKAKKK